jgi:hypothetical protein
MYSHANAYSPASTKSCAGPVALQTAQGSESTLTESPLELLLPERPSDDRRVEPAPRAKGQERSRTKAALSNGQTEVPREARPRCSRLQGPGRSQSCKLGATRLVRRRLRRLAVGIRGHVGSLRRWRRVIGHRSRLSGRRLLRLVGRLWLLSSALILHRH